MNVNCPEIEEALKAIAVDSGWPVKNVREAYTVTCGYYSLAPVSRLTLTRVAAFNAKRDYRGFIPINR
jgi:hypothetical protein